LAARVLPYAGRMAEWLLGRLGGLGGLLLHFLLTVVVSSILYTHGETAARGVVKFARRLAGQHGEKAAHLAAGAIRGVAFGVMVTALVQTLVAGLGLVIAAVPAAPLLASAILILCLAQLGPMLIMLPAVVWKFQSGDPLWGGVLLAFALVSGTIDNFIRPVLIRRGADLPLLLIFAGVIGGMISAGIVGIFAGPVILAVTHTLLKEWVSEQPAADGVVSSSAS
jgi:predicted PurR-regulated permease PerM